MTKYTAFLAQHPTDESLVFTRDTSGFQTEGVSVTTGASLGNCLQYQNCKPVVAPPLFVVTGEVTGINGSQILIDNLHAGNGRPNGWLDGCEVRFYRVVDDALTLVRTDRISSTAAKSRLNRPHNRHLPPGTTSYDYAPDSWNKPGATIHFAVVALDANLDRSPLSNIVSSVTADPYVAGSVNNPEAAGLTTDVELTAAVLPAPANLAVTTSQGGAVHNLTWDSVAEAVGGYQVFVSEYPDCGLASHLELAGDESAPVQAGDFAIIHRLCDDETKDALFSYRTWNLTDNKYRDIHVFPWDTDPSMTRLTENGEMFARLTRTASSQHTINRYSHAGSASGYYPALEPGVTYRHRLKVRAYELDGVTPKSDAIKLSMGGVDQGAYQPVLSAGWNTLDFDFSTSAEDTSDTVGTSALTLVGPCIVDVAVWEMFDTRAEHMKEWDVDSAPLIAEAAPEWVRTHAFCKTNPWSYNLDLLTRPGGAMSHAPDTLNGTLGLIRDAGSKPWLQIEWHWSDADWLGLAEYLCTPYDPATDTPSAKPWAYRRYADGQQTPWQDVFAKWRLELGNENWNGLAAFFNFIGETWEAKGKMNGLWLDYVVKLLETHPDWNPAKWEYVVGGWAARSANPDDWNHASAYWGTRADWFMCADYNGGWDEGQNTTPVPDDPDAWLSILSKAGVRRAFDPRHDRFVAMCETISQGRTKPIRYGTYEAGPGYALNGLNGASVTPDQLQDQKRMMKSVGAGTATLDYFLENASKGVQSQNFFVFGNKSNSSYAWGSHSKWQDGAKMNPPFMWMAFWNARWKGATVRKADYMIEPLQNTAEHDGVPMVGVYRIDKGAKTWIVLCNRDTNAARTLKVYSPARSPVVRHHLSVSNPPAPGEEFKVHNTSAATAEDVRFASESVSPGLPLVVTLGRGMAEVYEFG